MRFKPEFDNKAKQILEFENVVRLVGHISDAHLRDQAVYELAKRGTLRTGESPAGQQI